MFHNIQKQYPEVFLGKGVLKICNRFTGEHPCRSITLRHGFSPVNLLHIFLTDFPNNTSAVSEHFNVIRHSRVIGSEYPKLKSEACLGPCRTSMTEPFSQK